MGSLSRSSESGRNGGVMLESEQVPLENKHTQRESECSQMESERTKMESEHTQKESVDPQKHNEQLKKEIEHTQMESEPTQMESEPTQKESERTQKESERTQMESECTQMESERTQMESERTQRESKSPVDSSYSWVILVVAFLLNLTMNAGAGGMGVMLVELMHHFNVARSVIFWIGGIMVSVGFLASFLIGWLIKRFGCRVTGCCASVAAAASLIIASFSQSVTGLFVSYGFMLGFSLTFHFNIASIIIQQYFEKRRALAQGTLMSGLSGGLFVWPPFTRYMLDLYGWRGTMIILAGVQLHGVVLCALIRPFPKCHTKEYVYRPIYRKSITQLPLEKQNSPIKNGVMEVVTFEETDESHDVKSKMLAMDGTGRASMDAGRGSECCAGGRGARCFRALFKVLLVFPHFLLYMLAVTLVQTGNVMPYTLTPARADALGIDKHLGALLVTVSAGVSGVCRILCGLVADHRALNRLVLCGLGGIVGGALTALSTALTTFLGLVITFGLIGIPSAAFMATFGSAAVDIVGKKYVQQGVAMMSVAFGVAQLSTFLVTGWLNDLLGDPKYAFLVFGVAEALGGIVFIAVYFVDRRVKKNSVALPLE